MALRLISKPLRLTDAAQIVVKCYEIWNKVVMNAAFINPFISALLNVLKTMAQTELTPGKPRKKLDAVAQGDVSGLIGMVGSTMKGSLSISFDEELACDVMYKMLGEKPDGLNSEVTDMVGEITNMVCGGAKLELGHKGFEFDMATPLVVSGQRHQINHSAEGKKVILPFQGEQGRAYMEISFDEVK